MSLRKQKLAVFHQVSREEKPISINKILEKLGEGYAERSVRRWLAEMVKEGLVEKLGEKRATKYQAVRHARSAQVFPSCFEENSSSIIEKVQKPIYERLPIAYVDEWFDSYQPNVTFYIPFDDRARLYEAGRRLKREEPAGTYAHQIFHRLLIDLSYNSSRLEGNTYSLLETQRLILEGAGAEGKLDEEKTMILNHKEAIRYLVDTAPRLMVNKQTICTLHYLLADGLVETRYAGKVRDHGVRITGSTYIPYEDPRRLQAQLDRIVEKAAQIEDPYEQSLFLLIHLSYLQAFIDVNKRTARLSANIPLVKSNLVPLSFKDIDRDDYTSAMIAIYELQEVQPILDLYMFSYMRTCAVYDSTVKAMGFDEVRVRYRAQRRALVRDVILQGLVGEAVNKYISLQMVQGVKNEDRDAFLEDVLEDLREIDESRIVGLGITSDQLGAWLKKR